MNKKRYVLANFAKNNLFLVFTFMSLKLALWRPSTRARDSAIIWFFYINHFISDK